MSVGKAGENKKGRAVLEDRPAKNREQRN